MRQILWDYPSLGFSLSPSDGDPSGTPDLYTSTQYVVNGLALSCSSRALTPPPIIQATSLSSFSAAELKSDDRRTWCNQNDRSSANIRSVLKFHEMTIPTVFASKAHTHVEFQPCVGGSARSHFLLLLIS